MKAKDIALIGLLSATLTAGKLVLSFIPNVEIVTLLFIVYTVTFGFKKTLLVSVIFSTTEIFIYGFSTWLLIYYLIWPLLILITEVFKNKIKSEYGFAIIGSLFGFSFGLIFAVGESLFYGISYGIVYWVRGIPFDIIHGFSNAVVIILLFKPLVKVINNSIKKMY